jgi:hypothetical protein
VAIDGAGHLHVAGTAFRWVDEHTGTWTARIVYLTNTTGEWRRENVSDDNAYRRPSISVDAADNVAIAYNATSGTDCTGCEDGPVYVAIKRGGSWGEPQVVDQGAFGDASVGIADGVTHVAYQYLGYECSSSAPDAHPGPDCGTEYATDRDGQWAIQGLDAFVYGYPSLELSTSGLAQIAYVSTSGLRIASQAATGAFETEDVPLDPALADPRALQILTGHGDSPVVVTSETIYVELQVARSVLNGAGEVQAIAWDPESETNTGLWYENQGVESPVQIAGGSIDGADIAIDTKGVLYVVYSNVDGTWLTTRPSE